MDASENIVKIGHVRSPTETAMRLAFDHCQMTDEPSRKQRGQYFTPKCIADFMASLFKQIPEQVRILDSGAGIGILTAAICERISRSNVPKSVEVELFESDPDALAMLNMVLQECQQALVEAGHTLSFTIHCTDFIECWADSKQSLFSDLDTKPFNLVIMNPPYFKIRANSHYAALARMLGPSQPNIYSLFMAIAIDQLSPKGELVAITPRSFCNGLYFREFRRWLLRNVELLQIHSFGSRTAAFSEAKVLQENIITHFRRTAQASPRDEIIKLSRTVGRELQTVDTEFVDRKNVIDDSSNDALICVPETSQDIEVLKISEKWPTRFCDTGLRISTGPVVMFRTASFHRDKLTKGSVPLLTSHHINKGEVDWPKEKKKWPAAFSHSSLSQKHLIPCENYVLLKRFTSKEERRRLSSAPLLRAKFGFSHLAIENHVNYITHNDRELTTNETRGVAAFFNSALVDRYFRCFSGNTQVNATEVRTMKFPELKTLEMIGAKLATQCHEATVLDSLGIGGSARIYLKDFTFETG